MNARSPRLWAFPRREDIEPARLDARHISGIEDPSRASNGNKHKARPVRGHPKVANMQDPMPVHQLNCLPQPRQDVFALHVDNSSGKREVKHDRIGPVRAGFCTFTALDVRPVRVPDRLKLAWIRPSSRMAAE